MKQKLTELKGEADKQIIIVVDVYTLQYSLEKGGIKSVRIQKN